MAEIQWGLAQTPNFFQSAMQAQQAGQERRAEIAKRNAFQQYAADPVNGLQAVMAVDPAKGVELRQAAQQEQRQGRQDQWAMDDRQRAEVARKADAGVKLGLALKGLPPEQRGAYVQQQAPQLMQLGLSQQDLASIPLDDAGIDAGVRQAMSVGDYLQQSNADRTFSAGRADAKFNQGMETQKFGHTVQNDSARLGIDQQRLGLEGARLGIARQAEARQGAMAARTAQGRPIPAPIVTGYQENNTAVAKIDSAIAALRAHPKAVGLGRMAGDNVNQRLDPQGVDARAAMADIGSQKLHDRSGAAVSASESPRLMPFIPQVTDNSDTAIKKLTRLKQEYLSNNSQIETQFGSESGYQPLRVPQRAAPQQSQSAAPAASGGWGKMQVR